MQRVLFLVFACAGLFAGIISASAAPLSSNIAASKLHTSHYGTHVEQARSLGKRLRRHRFRKYRRARRWNIRRRARFGRIVAGVTLGTVIAAAVAGTAPLPPSPDLCWNWAEDGIDTHGYWYYCTGD